MNKREEEKLKRQQEKLKKELERIKEIDFSNRKTEKRTGKNRSNECL